LQQILFLKNRLLSASILLSLAGILGGVFGYIYQILMGRVLDPQDFSRLSAAVGMVVFCTSFFGAISMLITRKISFINHSTEYKLPTEYLNKIRLRCLLGCLLALPVIAGISEKIRMYLKIDSMILIWIMYIYLVAAIFHTINSACYQGLQKFKWLAFFAIYAMLAKLLFSAILIYFGLGLMGALWGLAIASISMMLIGWVGLKPYLSNQSYQTSNSFKNSISTFFPVYISTIAFTALTQLDVVMVHWFFPEEETAMYIASAVLGKSVLYLTGGLVVVMFPLVAENYAQNKSTKKIFWNAIVANILVGVTVTSFFYLYGEQIITLLYGSSYLAAGKLLPWFSLSMIPITIIILAEHYLIAKGKTLFAWIFFLTVPIALIAINFLHEDLITVILIIGIYGAIVGAIGFILMWSDINE
jgi:O-antigen/teichoic acid export membrane protein